MAADPINVELTYSNLDLDGDATPNDSVSFTLTATGGTNAAGDPFQRIFNQGIDTGFWESQRCSTKRDKRCWYND